MEPGDPEFNRLLEEIRRERIAYEAFLHGIVAGVEMADEGRPDSKEAFNERVTDAWEDYQAEAF